MFLIGTLSQGTTSNIKRRMYKGVECLKYTLDITHHCQIFLVQVLLNDVHLAECGACT